MTALGRMPVGSRVARPVVVAIGASNLSRGLPRLVAAVRRRTIAADLLAVAGHGRSYGAASRVDWRRLPAVLRCGLWRAVERLDPAGERPLWGVITDIGNGWDVLKKAGLQKEVGVIHLISAGGESGCCEINQNYAKEGAAAVELMSTHLLRNERGIPDFRMNVQIPPSWVEGSSLRPLPRKKDAVSAFPG